MYLNVNGFLGDENKTKIIKDNREINRVRNLIEKGEIQAYPKKVANNINKADMIFLSEIDPKSPATKEFITKMNENAEYEVLPPYGTDLEKLIGYSCTICLKKSEIEYTNKKMALNMLVPKRTRII